VNPRKRPRERLFTAPGKATAWGMAGCIGCAITATAGFGWAVAITIVTALAGCLR
jgi:hypothetical protein